MVKIVLMTLGFVMSAGLCFGNGSDFEYAIKHLSEYRSVSKQNELTKILDNAEKKAFPIKNITETAKYLKLANTVGGSADLEEYFSETIEKNFLKNPKGFVSVIKILDKPTRANVLKILRNPTFEDERAIAKILNKEKL